MLWWAARARWRSATSSRHRFQRVSDESGIWSILWRMARLRCAEAVNFGYEIELI
jgi:hypothetical protein